MDVDGDVDVDDDGMCFISRNVCRLVKGFFYIL